jgi:hypothetical protein
MKDLIAWFGLKELPFDKNIRISSRLVEAKAVNMV